MYKKEGAHRKQVTFQIITYRRIQTQSMHHEKWQDMDDAKGIDEIACDPPRSPQPVNQPNAGSNGIIVRPHR